jgi:predicted nucleic acid-binding Zn ribbon protein
VSDKHRPNATQVTPLSTVDSGKPAIPVDERSPSVAKPVADLAQSALSGAQRISRPVRRRTPGGHRRGGYSSSGADERDPQPIGQVAAELFAERDWEQPLAAARVFADWPSLVGAEIAARCQPVSLRDGELRLTAESTAWATQLRLLASALLSRLVAELGPHVVTRLSISGPVGPSWKHGAWSVPGARGPRDTYG